MNLRTVDLRALNSLTKYPSIPTYHSLDPRNGGLLDEVVPFTGPVIATEKVDGTNARIVQVPGGEWLLGSREEFLYARGDLIGNPSQGIVAALKQVAEELPPAEGIVLRTPDRATIAKARFQDYARTLKRRTKQSAPRRSHQ